MTLVLEHRLYEGTRIYNQEGRKNIALVVSEINVDSVELFVAGVSKLNKISLRKDQKFRIDEGLEIVLVDIDYNAIKCGYNATKDFDIVRWDYVADKSKVKKGK